MNHWFVTATKPHCEHVAQRHLANQQFETFLPLRRKTVRRARKLGLRKAPLFPGYLFVRFDVGARRWRSINATVGVRYIIMQDERPVPLPEGFVETLIGMTQDDGTLAYGHDLKVGDAVEIACGPFGRQVGELVALDDRGRVAVLLELLSSVVTVRTKIQNLLPA